MVNLNDQMDLIRQGTVEIFPEDELARNIENSISSGRPLRVKMGIDPTTADIHLGRMVGFGKMRQFQDAGHTGVVIIGDWTAQIGDPTGLTQVRPSLSQDDVKANAASYVSQLNKVIDPEKTEFKWQTEWFDGFDLAKIIELMRQVTAAQMLAHETFAQRLKNNQPLGVHELMYPVLMAYDSVAVKSDVELGGIDQKFNILVGRDLQRQAGQKPQAAVLMQLLDGVGTPGSKMGKTADNFISVTADASDMFGKAMRITDEQIEQYFALTTAATPLELSEIGGQLADPSVNPMHVKEKLGCAIVERYHGAQAATDAKAEFDRLFRSPKTAAPVVSAAADTATEGAASGTSDGAATVATIVPSTSPLPDNVPEFRIRGRLSVWICELLRTTEMADTNSEAKRLIDQGAVSLDDVPVLDSNTELEIADGAMLKVGKRRFARLIRI